MTKAAIEMTNMAPISREDLVRPSGDAAAIIGNAPDAKGTLLRVPKVIE